MRHSQRVNIQNMQAELTHKSMAKTKNKTTKWIKKLTEELNKNIFQKDIKVAKEKQERCLYLSAS